MFPSRNKKLLGAPGLTTTSKKASRLEAIAYFTVYIGPLMPAMASKTCRIWLLAVLMGPNGRFLHSGDESVCACILVSSSKAPVPSSDALVPSSFLLLLVRHLLLLAMHLLLLARFCCFLLLCPYDPNFASPSELSGCGKQLTMRGSSTAQSGALLMYSSLASLGSVPCDSCARSMLALEAAG